MEASTNHFVYSSSIHFRGSNSISVCLRLRFRPGLLAVSSHVFVVGVGSYDQKTRRLAVDVFSVIPTPLDIALLPESLRCSQLWMSFSGIIHTLPSEEDEQCSPGTFTVLAHDEAVAVDGRIQVV